MYVHDTVKPKKLAKKRQRLTQVFEMNPLDKVTFMNFDLNLSKYLTPRVIEPIMTDTRPMKIARYS